MTETDKSHVMRYGDTTFTNEVIGDYEGDLDAAEALFMKIYKQHHEKKEKPKHHAKRH